MFAKPTARKKTGRKSHDRCPAKPEALDLSTVPNVRGALRGANLAAVAKIAGCTADVIKPFKDGKKAFLPPGIHTRVVKALIKLHEAGNLDHVPAP
jgi:hypothetical protein